MRLDHLLSRELPGRCNGGPICNELDAPIEGAQPHPLVVSFERTMSFHSFGGNGGGEPHVPISNTTVKPSSADGTWTAGSRESRTPPSGPTGFLWVFCCLEADASEAAFASQKLSVCFRSKLFVKQKFLGL